MAGERDPITDPARLEEIVTLGLLGSNVDPVLQDLAAKAVATVGLPVSLVSVVLDEALLVAGAHGIEQFWLAETGGHPVEWSFCATSVRTRDAFVVEDAMMDDVHRTNPLVTQDGVRCYAGVPLISSRGFVLGNLCVVGLEARRFTGEEMDALRELAQHAVGHIESGRS